MDEVVILLHDGNIGARNQEEPAAMGNEGPPEMTGRRSRFEASDQRSLLAKQLAAAD